MAEITYGTTTIQYTIVYSYRKTLGICVNRDCQVMVKAPFGASMAQIEKIVTKRTPWILKQQQYFKSLGEKMPPRRYISGESHLYLGKQYVLRVTEGATNDIRFEGHSFEIVCKPQKNVETRLIACRLMKDWYREQAQILFAEMADPIILRFKKYKVAPTGLSIKSMVSRWGSCTPKGKIILNTELIKAPKPCIEYVITHELCHLVHRNHAKVFYELLAKEMPDWERWKKQLKQIEIY